VTGKEAGGITLELIKAGGEKIGKSAGNAVWLNATPYTLYQYCFNLPDVGMDELLHALTHISSEEIAAIDVNDTRSK
jgi:tyrosyl-tRNA synthetase